MKKLYSSVSIGIPAYNEEANIKKLLLSLLNQKADNFTIKEIIVVSDKSTDNTVKVIKSIRSKKIKLVQNRKRLGQANGQNKIIKIFTGDILVLLNGDVLPSDYNFVGKLVNPFNTDNNLGLVVPRVIPIKANNLFGSVINYSIDFKDSIFENWCKGSNLYMCSGRGRAFKKDFAKKIYWKDSLSEDAFSYLLCIKKGYKFKYLPTAKLYFKSPDNFVDHVKQSARFSQGPRVMSKYFDKKFVKKEYTIPRNIASKTAIQFFIKNPLLFFLYMITFFAVNLNPQKSKYAKSNWQISESSKKLSMYFRNLPV